MTRESIVKKIVDEHPLWEMEIEDGIPYFLVFYSFRTNPSHRFYKALEKLGESIHITRLRNGVLRVLRLNEAYTLSRLIIHYKGEYEVVKAFAFDYEDVFDKFR